LRPNKVKFKDTLHAHLGRRVNSLLFDIDVHPNDFCTSSHVNAMMKLFKRNTTSHDDFTVTIMNPMQFRLSVGFIAAGLSLRHVENVLDTTKRLRNLQSDVPTV
jgi:hypothetical protein